LGYSPAGFIGLLAGFGSVWREEGWKRTMAKLRKISTQTQVNFL